MTIKYPYEEGEVVVYTDGLCFIDSKYRYNLPGIDLIQDTTAYPSKARMFTLTEGWWWIPPTYRMAVYSYQEIVSNAFLDITTRISIEPGNFVYLEEEIKRPGIIAGMADEIYYDITFHTEETLIEEIKKDLDIIDSGNLIKWKNKIEVIDYIYG